MEQDFLRCGQSRSMADYQRLLELCRVFLQGKSFTAFSGGQATLALLFPMERVFESYVAAVLRQNLDSSQYRVHAQANGKYLFDLPKERFALRPDLVIEDLNSGEKTVLDTKWKLLSPQWHNYGISQADMYQMYAYQKEYAAKQTVLLYPDCEAMADQKIPLCYSSSSGSLVRVQTLHLDSPIAMAETVRELLDVASQPSK